MCSWRYQVLDHRETEMASLDVRGSHAILSFQGQAYYLLPAGQLFQPRHIWVRDDGGIAAQRYWFRPTVSEEDYPPVCVFTRPPGWYLGYRFNVALAGETLLLQRERGTFTITRQDQVVGLIKPQHAFTRRAVILCEPSVPLLTQLFCFGKVALLWRAESDSAASSAGAGV